MAVSGPDVPRIEKETRDRVRASAAVCFHPLPFEPRPDWQSRFRRASSPCHLTRCLSRIIGAAVLFALHAYAFHGPGMGHDESVSLFLRPQRAAWSSDH